MDTKHIAPVVRSAVDHALDKAEPHAARVAPVVRNAVDHALEKAEPHAERVAPVVCRAVGHAVERAVERAVVPASEHVRPAVQDAVSGTVARVTEAAAPAVTRVRPARRRKRLDRHRRRWVTPFGPAAADTSLLGLRLTFGGYLVGHGAQKLFGAFGGHGPRGTGEHFEQLGLRPGVAMSLLAGTTELFGGALTATGTASPLGPIMGASTMVVAAGTAHRGKGVFVQTGGPELPLMNLAAAAVLAALGPGRFSVDRLTGTRLPGWMARAVVGTGIALSAGLVAWSIVQQRAATRDAAGDEAAPGGPVPARREPAAVAHTG
jgi:putative oxidoreductase